LIKKKKERKERLDLIGENEQLSKQLREQKKYEKNHSELENLQVSLRSNEDELDSLSKYKNDLTMERDFAMKKLEDFEKEREKK